MIRGAFPSIDVSASGLSVQRTRMNITASNIANVNTTKTNGEIGSPYKRKRAIVSSENGPGTFQLVLNRQDSRLSVTNGRHLQQGVNLLKPSWLDPRRSSRRHYRRFITTTHDL